MSGYKRFFVQEVLDTTEVCGEEYNHAVNTLRLRTGDKIILCDNTGFDYVSEVVSIEKKQFVAKVIQKEENFCESKEDVTLICGLLKGDKTELVVQKAVELGVKKIVVYSSRYSSAYANDNKISRLNRVSVEASKQCGRSIAPKVVYAETFKQALEYGNNAKNKIFACEFINEHSTTLEQITGSCAIVVGSEGGFTQEEAECAFKEGYVTVSLGKRILRAETAAITLTAIVMFSLGEMK